MLTLANACVDAARVAATCRHIDTIPDDACRRCARCVQPFYTDSRSTCCLPALPGCHCSRYYPLCLFLAALLFGGQAFPRCCRDPPIRPLFLRTGLLFYLLPAPHFADGLCRLHGGWPAVHRWLFTAFAVVLPSPAILPTVQPPPLNNCHCSVSCDGNMTYRFTRGRLGWTDGTGLPDVGWTFAVYLRAFYARPLRDCGPQRYLV